MTPTAWPHVATELGPLLCSAEQRRQQATNQLEPRRRAEYGQFLTRAEVSAFIASLFDVPDYPARLLDPGAGVGSLTAALIDRFHEAGSPPLQITAVEVDEKLAPALSLTLEECRQRTGATCELVLGDFLRWGVDRSGGFGAIDFEPFDLVIMNPPYRKIGTNSSERQAVVPLGVEVSNLYAAFVSVAVRLLKPGGQLVAITPRSFANGPYFRSFRRDFLERMALRAIHVYEQRDSAFDEDAVLQENIIFRADKDTERKSVFITSSHGFDDGLASVREVPYEQVVRSDDRDKFIHLTVDEAGAAVSRKIRSLGGSLPQIGVQVSTGRVVDFRTRQNLRAEPEPGTVPLLYPSHLTGGRVNWPNVSGKKPNALAVNDDTAPLLLPNGTYVLVKRFTSKEERRRLVAVLCGPEDAPGAAIGFENHLNVFHDHNKSLSETVARGLAAYLNSTLVDLFFRQFNGHTQVNASDLRQLPYPTLAQLEELGAAAAGEQLSQESIDALVSETVRELADEHGEGPLALHVKVTEAQAVLRELGLPRPQTNERSALTLLALLDLPPAKSWSEAAAPLVGITPMMEFMAEHYGKRYAPNSRETVRRQTVHQFVAAGVAVINPDDPSRPTNSGQTVYQVPEQLLTCLRAYNTGDWEQRLAGWKALAPTLVERWARIREMNMVPVTLPDGEEVALSPGGQNPLIKAIIEEFCPRFAPGGHVLYIGDTGDKFVVWERDALASIGVDINEKGKMPDVVIHDHERGWLLLIEAVTSHGPVDPKRHEELATLFGDCEVGLVYVTAFLDRRTLAERLPTISWETEVWIAEDSTHMVHFDGARFLGPYEV